MDWSNRFLYCDEQGHVDVDEFDLEKQMDDLPYTSFDRQFDRFYQFCFDGMFDPDLAIFYFHKMSQTFHRFWYDCFVYSLDIVEISLYD